MKDAPRGIRNHNPGNIRRSADPWQGLADPPHDGTFFRFVSAPYGIRALARVLIAYQDKHGIRTIRDLIHRWAPPNENDTESYVAAVAKAVGVGPLDTISTHDHDTMAALVKAIIRHENGQQPYSDAVIDKGLALAGIEADQKPIGSTRTIRGAQIAGAATLLPPLAEMVAPVMANVEAARPLLDLWPDAGFAKWAMIAIAVVGIGMIVWARFDDRRRGLR